MLDKMQLFATRNRQDKSFISIGLMLQFLFRKASTEIKNSEEVLSDEGVWDQVIFYLYVTTKQIQLVLSC